jgi:hypothetical protein
MTVIHRSHENEHSRDRDRLVGSRHLTPENHEAVLARAQHQRKEQIEALVAELAPRPDVVPFDSGAARDGNGSVSQAATAPLPAAPRPILQALAPGRYRVQFTIGQEGYDKLRRLQALLRREVPNGDCGVIFERFVEVLLDKVERDKLGKRRNAKSGARVRRSKEMGRSTETSASRRAYENRIRFGTDRTDPRDTPIGLEDRKAQLERQKAPSRYIPNAIKRAVWFRDRAQCAFAADSGHRCSERSFLRLHHIHPYALNGPATVDNLSLRCPRHNQYEAELVFGRRNGGSA